MRQERRERAVRSDSIRNRDAILEAAAVCLEENPRASLADIAEAAGVGRVTLYGHFASRQDLLLALVERTMERIEHELSGVDLSGTTWEALDALVVSSWKLLHRVNVLRGVLEQELPDQAMHQSHGGPRSRVEHLLARGRADGSFRTDQTLAWQVACYFAILHGVASEIRAGRLSEREAAGLLPQTLQALLRATSEA